MSREIVLIHGGWHGGWCFDKVTAPLRDMGLVVHAPDLPLEGVEGDIDFVRKLLVRVPNSVLLGHSYGGLVVTHAAAEMDVAHLVYLCSLMPDKGEDQTELLTRLPSPALNNATRIDEADGTFYPDPAGGVEAFYHDCDPNEAADYMSKTRPQKIESLPMLNRDPAWRSVLSTYVLCTDDRALNPEIQAILAKRANSVIELDVAHSPFLAIPDRLVKLLWQLAEDS